MNNEPTKLTRLGPMRGKCACGQPLTPRCFYYEADGMSFYACPECGLNWVRVGTATIEPDGASRCPECDDEGEVEEVLIKGDFRGDRVRMIPCPMECPAAKKLARDRKWLAENDDDGSVSARNPDLFRKDGAK